MARDLVQLIPYVVLLGLCAPLLGAYLARVFSLQRTWLDPVARPLERLIYKLSGIQEDREMTWRQYAAALLAFNCLGILLLFLLQRLQGILPLNPQHLPGVPSMVALNTAVSFVTNTNWQAYAGETTMSYFTQMVGLTVQNFVSAATGIAVAVALIRGLTRKTAQTIGNFWVDLTRSVLWVLLPVSLVFALVLISQGVIQSLSPYHPVTTVEGGRQVLAMGPVASQEAIKEFGTNGGGFFNANAAHPFENPSALTSLLEVFAILWIPAALPFTFGRMVGNRRQGHVILAAMTILFVALLGFLYFSEASGNPQLARLGLSGPSAMEGKEVRFGLVHSAVYATATTATSTGSVNTMHSSLTPLGGLVPMFQMMLGEVIFGGVGTGLYSMLIFVVLTVFIVGLMVGRTPEYLGKKIEAFDVKMATLGILIPSVCILFGSATAAITRAGTASVLNPGPHGLSEILYAFSSASANNGSAFAGLNASTPFYTLSLALAMFVGRFGVILPVLAIAGNQVGKKAVAPGPGTFQTEGALFVALLIGVVLIVGALTFFPALALGPIIEHLLLWAGRAF
ncbi:MAG: potassium-transporting ATPase subunit KdpA [Chitinophagales bacterium]